MFEMYVLLVKGDKETELTMASMTSDALYNALIIATRCVNDSDTFVEELLLEIDNLKKRYEELNKILEELHKKDNDVLVEEVTGLSLSGDTDAK